MNNGCLPDGIAERLWVKPRHICWIPVWSFKSNRFQKHISRLMRYLPLSGIIQSMTTPGSDEWSSRKIARCTRFRSGCKTSLGCRRKKTYLDSDLNRFNILHFGHHVVSIFIYRPDTRCVTGHQEFGSGKREISEVGSPGWETFSATHEHLKSELHWSHDH